MSHLHGLFPSNWFPPVSLKNVNPLFLSSGFTQSQLNPILDVLFIRSARHCCPKRGWVLPENLRLEMIIPQPINKISH